MLMPPAKAFLGLGRLEWLALDKNFLTTLGIVSVIIIIVIISIIIIILTTLGNVIVIIIILNIAIAIIEWLALDICQICVTSSKLNEFSLSRIVFAIKCFKCSKVFAEKLSAIFTLRAFLEPFLKLRSRNKSP